jgi:hypothetical protein
VKQFKLGQKVPWNLIIIFLCLSLGIALAGYRYYQGQKEHLKQEKSGELSAIADLKVKQIVNWRKERLGDADLVKENPWIGLMAKRFLSGEPSPFLRDEILAYMSSILHNQFDNVLLLDLKGKVRLSIPDKEEEIGPDAYRLALEAVSTKKTIFSNLYRSKISGSVRLSLLIPLFTGQKSTPEAVGIFLLILQRHLIFERI